MRYVYFLSNMPQVICKYVYEIFWIYSCSLPARNFVKKSIIWQFLAINLNLLNINFVFFIESQKLSLC